MKTIPVTTGVKARSVSINKVKVINVQLRHLHEYGRQYEMNNYTTGITSVVKVI